MKKLMVSVVSAACAALSSFATDYYVSTNGVDDAGGGTAGAPFATIAYALGKAQTSGDIVYVSEGTYTEGGLVLKAGVGVVATGSRNKTIIDVNASESSPRRCVESMGAKSYLKGFTVQNAWINSYGGAINADANSAVINCAFYNCYGSRGGAGRKGVWIRCYFASSNTAPGPAKGYASALYGPWFVANCVFDGSGCCGSEESGSKIIVNSTFCNGGYLATNSGGNTPRTFNSLINCNIGNYMSVTNCVCPTKASNDGAVAAKDDRTLFSPITSTRYALDGMFAPKSTANALLGRGTYEAGEPAAVVDYYKALFPEDWKEIGEWEKDYIGQSRYRDGALDIGACQSIGIAYDTWYVNDATGNDDNFGSDPEAPKKTIASAIAMCKSGDVVKVAEGTYAGGFSISAGVGVEATGARDKTIIDGQDTVRCVESMEALSYIKGFTIQHGFCGGNVNCGGGIQSAANAAVIDCWFFNNTSQYRGAAGTKGIWIRCFFDSTNVETPGSSVSNGWALYQPDQCFNCVFKGQGSFGKDGSQYYSCTFISPAKFGPNSGTATSANTIYSDLQGTVTLTACKQEYSPMTYLNEDYSPLATYAAVIGQASAEAYANATNGSPWAAYLAVDFNGLPRARKNGAMDIGACQNNWRISPMPGYDFTVTEPSAGRVRYAFTRNDASEKPLVTLSFEGQSVNFDEQEAGYVFTVELDGTSETTFDAPVLTYDASAHSTWYVATDGDDTRAGYRAEFALQTIAAALAKAKNGDTVSVAAGTYSEGGLAIPNGVGVVSQAGRAQTTIDAQDLSRCISSMGYHAYIKGFTLTRGRVPGSEGGDGGNGGGVLTESDAAIIDCAVTHCAGYRGAAGNGGVWIRCYIGSPESAGWSSYGSGIYGMLSAINCVFDGVTAIGNSTSCKILNCTTIEKKVMGTNSESTPPQIYNSLVRDTLNGVALYASTLAVASNNQVKASDNLTIYSAASASYATDSAYRPLITATNLIGKASKAYYDEQFPEYWRTVGEWQKDYNGASRFRGTTLDVGACQFDWLAAENTGVHLTVTDLEGENKRLTVSRRFDSEKLCTGFTYDGETVNFADADESAEWHFDVTGDPFAKTFEALYAASQTTWYADDENGDDDNRGYHPKCARKTLKAAMALAQSGDTVYAAEGTYDEETETFGVVDCRVVVKSGVGLVASGSRDKTIILGQWGAEEQFGLGEGAIRCVTVRNNGYVKGFTIKDGATPLALGIYVGGGGVYCEDNGAAVDCVVQHCVAARGGATYGGYYIGCYLDNSNYQVAFSGTTPTSRSNAGTFAAAYDGTYVNTVFNGCEVVLSGKLVNCSVLGNNGQCRSRETAARFTISNTYIGRKPDGVSTMANNIVNDECAAGTVTNAYCRFSVPVARTQLDANYEPKAHSVSVLVGAGDASLYDTCVPEAFRSFLTVDCAGNPRKAADGSIDVGAGQHQWTKSGSIILFR